MSSTAYQKTDPQSVIEDLRVLLAKNVQDNMRLAKRFGGLVKEATEQFGATSEGGGLPKGSELLTRWLDLNFAFYSLLANHGIAFLDDLLGAAERNLGTKHSKSEYSAEPDSPTHTAEAVRRLELSLSARVGEVAIAPFVIENQQSSLTGVTFQASDFISPKGDTVSADCIRFEPASLSLLPKEQTIVKSIVTVTNRFKVGETYVATINVLGFETKQIIFVVTILLKLEDQKPVRKPASKKARTRSSKKAAKRRVKP